MTFSDDKFLNRAWLACTPKVSEDIQTPGYQTSAQLLQQSQVQSNRNYRNNPRETEYGFIFEWLYSCSSRLTHSHNFSGSVNHHISVSEVHRELYGTETFSAKTGPTFCSPVMNVCSDFEVDTLKLIFVTIDGFSSLTGKESVFVILFTFSCHPF
jgi:hypothetical protein